MAVNINREGLRQKPGNDGIEYPFHMTCILKKLYPGVCWHMDERLKDENGNIYHRGNNPRTYYKPDFRNDDLMMIIEIYGSGGRFQRHYVDDAQCVRDEENIAFYKSLGYKVVVIPMFVQLDSEMIDYYFNIEYKGDPLYPASSEHGFLHPGIALPISFCRKGIERFEHEMKNLPDNVRQKVIYTLQTRINNLIENGEKEENAKRKVIPQKLDYLLGRIF